MTRAKAQRPQREKNESELSVLGVPSALLRLRDLTRQQTKLVQQRNAVDNRIQKVLETANIKLGSVASDVLGVSGRKMIEGLLAGEKDGTTFSKRRSPA